MAGLLKNRHVAVDEIGRRAWNSYPGFAESASFLSSCILKENVVSIENDLLQSDAQFDIDIIKLVLEWSPPSFFGRLNEKIFLTSTNPLSICFGLWLSYFKYGNEISEILKLHITHESAQVRETVSRLSGLTRAKELLEPLLEIISQTGVSALWAACVIDPSNPRIRHRKPFLETWDSACLLIPHWLYLAETNKDASIMDHLAKMLDRHIYIYLLGFWGQVDSVPEIIEHFGEPEYAAVAGKAYTLITGLELCESTGHLLEFSDEKTDILGALGDAMQEWRHYGKEDTYAEWHARQAEFDPKMRYRFGKPITESLLQSRLRQGNADLYERYHTAMERSQFYSTPYLDPTCPSFHVSHH
jgi:hypothetical protein